MKGTVVALDHLLGRPAAALVHDGRLEDFVIDPPADAAPQAGAIFRARPGRPVKGLGGAFVDLPGGARGFLRQTDGLAPGRPVLVQVSGQAEPGKAVPVTTRLLFKSRFAILTPGAPGLNLSRAIREPELRARLAALAGEAMAGAGPDLGLVLRTAAGAVDAGVLADDIAALRAAAAAVLADCEGGPELLLDAPGAHEFAWREWAHPAPDAVEDRPGAFADLGVEELLDAALDPAMGLGEGASMVLEPTRALVAVDVNTGADTTPAAGMKANTAAARALPRALRVRGLGGQVTVDFAPMPRRDRGVLEQVMKAAFRDMGEEVTLAGWTPLGHYELTRRRDRLPLAEALRGWPG